MGCWARKFLDLLRVASILIAAFISRSLPLGMLARVSGRYENGKLTLTELCRLGEVDVIESDELLSAC